MSEPITKIVEVDTWDALEKKLDRLLGEQSIPEQTLKVQAVPKVSVKKPVEVTPWKDEKTYFEDLLFLGVGPVVEEPEFAELRVKDKIQMVDFFPNFTNGAFEELALENFLLQWYGKKIGQEEPGLYLRMDIRLGGALDSVLDIIQSFISESNILIRLSAHLGFTLDATAGSKFKELTFAGALEGVVVQYPIGVPLLTIYSVGVRLVLKNLKKNTSEGQASSIPNANNTSKSSRNWTTDLAKSTALLDKGIGSLDKPTGPVTEKKEATPAASKTTSNSAFRAEVFGNIKLNLPGDILPLHLQYTASLAADLIHLNMVLRRGKVWLCPLGVKGITLTDLVITADIPVMKTNKGMAKMTKGGDLDEGFSCEFSGSWAWHTRVVTLSGKLYSAAQTHKVSFIEGTLKRVTFEDIKQLAKSVHQYDVEKPDRKMEFDTLKLHIESGKLSLRGEMKLDDALATVSIWISREGLRFTGSIEQWRLENGVIIKTADLNFIIGRRKKGDTSDPFGGLGKDGKGIEGKDVEGQDVKGKPNDTLNNKTDNATSMQQRKEEIAKGSDTKSHPEADKRKFPFGKTPVAAQSDFKDSARNEATVNAEKAAVTAKEAAEDNNTSVQPKKLPPPAEVTWFVGMRISGDIILPFGEKESMAPDAEHKLRIQVTLSITNTDKGDWEFLVAGRASTAVSLRDFFPNAIEEGGFFDAKLSDFTFFGTNMKEAYVPPEIFRNKITKGFYIAAVLDRVPGLEDGTTESKALKKPSGADRAYLKIGYAAGQKIPKVAVFLPPSFKIDFGERFYTGAIYPEIDPSATPVLKFFGELYMRIEEGREEPLKITMELGVDAVTGSLGLLMEKKDGISNFLNLGKQVKLYHLGGSLSVKWPVFLASGTIDTFGITTSIGVNEDRYEATLVIGPNPANTLIKFVAPKLDLGKIGVFIMSAVDKEMELPQGNVICFNNVDIYSSAGITYFGEFYPRGIRFKGEVQIMDWRASMDAELSTMGFVFKTKMENFKLGPLIVRGARPEDKEAILEVELTFQRQMFRLNGMIQIFDSWVMADIHCQLMPKKIFYFKFALFWSAGLYINVRAEMVSAKTIEDPKAADWVLEATIQQTLIAQAKAAVMTCIEKTHEALQTGVGAAIKKADEAQAEYDRSCEAAKASLNRSIQEHEAAVQKLRKEIAEATAKLEQVKLENAKSRSNASMAYNSSISQAEKDRASRLEPHNVKYQDAHGKINKANSEQPWKEKDAMKKRDEKRTEFMRVFGDVESNVQKALDDVSRARGVVSRLEGEIAAYNSRISSSWWRADLHAARSVLKDQLTLANIGLWAYEKTLRGVQTTLQSEAFKSLKQAMVSAMQALDILIEGFKSRIASLQHLANEAFEELQAAINEGNLSFERLKIAAQLIRDKVEAELKRQEDEEIARSALLSKQLQETGKFIESSGYILAKDAVDFAQKNNFALIAAKKALEEFKALDQAAYEAVKGFATDVLDALVDIQLMHFRGEIKANKDDQKPFTLIIGGTLGAKDKRFLFAIQWMPGQTSQLLAELGKRALEVITGTYRPTDLENRLQGELRDVFTIKT